MIAEAIESGKNYRHEFNAQFGLQETYPLDKDSKRCGLLGYKAGMTQFYDKWGARVPVTVLHIDRVQVVHHRPQDKYKQIAMQLGIGEANIMKLKKAQAGTFLKHGLPPKKDLGSFVVNEENVLPIGYMLGPDHFKIGQLIDVQGISKGKGTQGVI